MKLTKLSLILGCYVLLLSCSPADKSNRLKKAFELGNKKLDEGYFDDAVAMYSKVIEMDPSVIDAYMNRGVAYAQSGHYVLALADYNYVLQQMPEYNDILFNRAYAYYELDRLDMAESDVLKLKTIYPDTALNDVIHGLIFEKRGDHTNAIQRFTAAIEKDPYQFDAWSNRAIAKFESQSFLAAKADIRKALELKNNEPYAMNIWAMIEMELGQLEKADSILILATKAIFDHPYFLNNRGKVQMKMGNLEQADSLISLSLKLDSSNLTAQKNYMELQTLKSIKQ